MSGSRNSSKKVGIFNPRASNEWSKNDSKFGQKMLEKMGWKKGQGIGLHNQGISENIKVRTKLDSKGLGYKIKEDQWVEVRNEFSELLSQLSETVKDDSITGSNEKKSLEAVSQLSKTRVHYHKFTHGKDIARYKKEDLIGILGKKEETEDSTVNDKKEFIHKGNMEEYFKSKRSKKLNTNDSCIIHKNDETEMKPLYSHCDKLNDENSHSNDDSANLTYPKKKTIKSSITFNETEEEIITDRTTVEITKKENTRKKKSKKVVDENVHAFHSDKLPNSEVVNPGENGDERIAILVNDNLLQNDDVESMAETKKKSKRKRKHSFQCSEINKIDEEAKFEECLASIHNVTQVTNSCPRKKKLKNKSSNDITDYNIEKNETCPETAIAILENDEKNIDSYKRKKKCKHASDQTEKKPESVEKSLRSDSTEIAEHDSKLIDNSSSKKKKRKKYSVEEPKKTQENSSDTVGDVADFMKSVVDYNSANNVEDYIEQFEKNREELLNKYREKYKTKYSMTAAENIEIYGDEFDGRKLDCKKPTAEEKLIVKDSQRRNASKAERIVAKARLLKNIKDNIVTHDFKGSNLETISGYGSVIY